MRRPKNHREAWLALSRAIAGATAELAMSPVDELRLMRVVLDLGGRAGIVCPLSASASYLVLRATGGRRFDQFVEAVVSVVIADDMEVAS